jgi:hypothetical protein
MVENTESEPFAPLFDIEVAPAPPAPTVTVWLLPAFTANPEAVR